MGWVDLARLCPAWLSLARPALARHCPARLNSPQLTSSRLGSAWRGPALPSFWWLCALACLLAPWPCFLVPPTPAPARHPFGIVFVLYGEFPRHQGAGAPDPDRDIARTCLGLTWFCSAWPCLDQLHSIQSGLGWLALARPRLPWVGSTRLGPAPPSPAQPSFWCLGWCLVP